jgi:hypothetical protein
MRGGSCNGGCGDDRGLGEARAGVNGGGVVTNSVTVLLYSLHMITRAKEFSFALQTVIVSPG